MVSQQRTTRETMSPGHRPPPILRNSSCEVRPRGGVESGGEGDGGGGGGGVGEQGWGRGGGGRSDGMEVESVPWELGGWGGVAKEYFAFRRMVISVPEENGGSSRVLG